MALQVTQTPTAAPHRVSNFQPAMLNGCRPALPGAQYGGTVEQIRDLINKQQRSRGFTFTVAAGRNQFNIPLSGMANIFLGIKTPDVAAIVPGTLALTLNINSEIIFQDMDHNYFLTANAGLNQPYVPYPRPLSGNDVITLIVDSPAFAGDWWPAFWFI